MTLQEIMQEVRHLDVEERKLLLTMITESLDEEEKIYDLLDFAGIGAHLADDIDPQEYINQLRSEWDHRP